MSEQEKGYTILRTDRYNVAVEWEHAYSEIEAAIAARHMIKSARVGETVKVVVTNVER